MTFEWSAHHRRWFAIHDGVPVGNVRCVRHGLWDHSRSVDRWGFSTREDAQGDFVLRYEASLAADAEARLRATS